MNIESSESSFKPSESIAKPEGTGRASLVLGSMGMAFVGFFVGLLVTPFKGEVGLSFAASTAFAAWLLWSSRVGGRKTSFAVIAATLIVAIPLIFIFVGCMHNLVNY
jgi:hypothetical protein